MKENTMTEPEAVVPQVPKRRYCPSCGNDTAPDNECCPAYWDAVNAAEAKVRELEDEIADDNSAVRTVAAECRKDDEVTIAQQAATIERLTDALEHIKQHQEIVAGNMCGHTSAWTIANTALNYREKI